MVFGLSNFSQIVRGSQPKTVLATQNIAPNKNPSRSLLRDITGNIAGAGLGMAFPVYTLFDTFNKITPADAKDMVIEMKEFCSDVDNLERTKNVAAKILEESGLKSKGVTINYIDGTPESLNKLKDIIKEATNKSMSMGKSIDKRIEENLFETFKAGANAAFFPDVNAVVVNSKNLYTTVYHELGHAMNKNGNWFTKGLEKAKRITPFNISLFAPVFLAVGLLHKVDNNKPKEEKGFVEKSLDFISNNAGKLTFATYTPVLAEEGLASIRGLKAAAKHLPKDVIQKMSVNAMKAWSTYAGVAVAVSGGVALGIHVANKIKEKKRA